jgi:hypothetical protein
MARSVLSPETRDLANRIVLTHRQSGVLLVKCLRKAFEDIDGKGSKGGKPEVFKTAKDLLRPLLVKPNGMPPSTFNVYCSHARKAIRYNITWRHAISFGINQIQEAVAIAHKDKSEAPFAHKLGAVLDSMRPQVKEKKSTKPPSIYLGRSPRKWVRTVALHFRTDRPIPEGDDPHSALVRSFILRCIELENRELVTS